MSYSLGLSLGLFSAAILFAACGSDEDSGGTGGKGLADAGGQAGGGGAGGAAGGPPDAGGATSTGPLLEADCDPIGVHCGYPFPSDVYLEEDSSTPSGRSVQFGATTLPKVNGETPIDPSLFAELDGWSVAPSPQTFMPGATTTGLADIANMASTLAPSSPTILLNADTGELVAHWVDLDTTAPTPDQAIMLRPAVVLDYATRYIVAIRGVVDAGGALLEPTDVFRALRDGTDHDDPSVASRRAHYADIFNTLDDAGIAKDDLQIAWDFTTGTRESITGRMLAVRDAALAAVGDEGPEFVVSSVEDAPNSMIKHRLILTATVPLYLTTDSYMTGDPPAELMFGPDGNPMQNGTMQMEVLVQVPNSIDSGTPHGFLQNGHGFFGTKNEGRNGYQAMAANGWNWINVAVDLFGFAEADLAVAADALLGRPELLRTFVDRQIQGHVNQLLAMRMMIGRVATNGITDDTGRVVLDPAQIDPSVRAYRGDSQGGIMGGTYMSISTDVTRGLLGEPGVGYSWIWQRSVDSDQYSFFVRQTYTDSPFDFQMLLQLTQLIWDQSEPSGFLRTMSGDTLAGTPDHHVLLHTAIGDHEVPTVLAHTIARTIDAKLIRSNDAQNPYPREVFGVEAVDTPVENVSGLVEYEFGIEPEPLGLVPPTAGCNPHDRVRVLTPSFEQQDLFFRTGRIEWFCDGICNCDDSTMAGEEEGCRQSFVDRCQ